MKKIILLTLLFLPCLIHAQVSNDECMFAEPLGNIPLDLDFCTEEGEYDNFGATLSPEPLPFCWFNDGVDVWFSFTPTGPGIYIQLFGDALNTTGNVDSPSMALYSGNCNNLTEIGCASISGGINIIELISTDLVIGQVYYLRVAARNDNQGEFDICLRSYIPTPSPQSDCPDAVVLCDKTGFIIENLDSVGDLPNEMNGDCVDEAGVGGQENASVWYTWTCDISGTLEFTLTPNNPNSNTEDIDFVVYRLPGGLNDCANRQSLRCMFSGETAGQASSPCFGPTGLIAGDSDLIEFPGCQSGDNNFAAPIDMVSGESYGILINNFSQSGFGFSIEFGGSGTFLGPEVDFAIDTTGLVECDKLITFSEDSESLTDEIIQWNWTFGTGAQPTSTATASQANEAFDIEYESFGDKIVSLTVTTSRGCTVTKIEDLFIAPCCQDTSTLLLNAFDNQINCPGQQAVGMVAGENGSPTYMYAINSPDEFQLNPNFNNLDAGDYNVFVQDIKGCEADTTLTIFPADSFSVNIITPDTEVELGNSVDIEAEVIANDPNVTITWDPAEGLSCPDCLTPTSFSPGTTTYEITIEDENGCISRDQVTITTVIKTPVFGPTVFTPDGLNNTTFTLGFFSPQVKSFNSLRIYDRWGNLVYEGFGLPINDFTVGWDGKFKGDDVNPGVFTWIAEVDFIDNVIRTFTGSTTVAR